MAEIRPCRWYDPYPQLEFALRLLYLAPAPVRQSAMKRWFKSMEHQLGCQTVEKLSRKNSKLDVESLPKNRWYDLSGEITLAMECLRHSPDMIKELSAQRMLDCLMEQSA